MTGARVAGRGIGLGGGTAIVIGSMLGVGIFLTPRLVATATTSPSLFLLLWAVGGLIALAGAVTYAELGTMMPDAGGDYVYLRRAFGSSTSFAAGCLLFLGVFAGSIASMSAATCRYQLALLAASAGVDLEATWFEVPVLGWSLSGIDAAAISLIVLLTAVNALGVRLSTITQSLLTMIPLAVLLGLAIFALGTVPHATVRAPVATEGGPAALGGALLNIYFAYAGWNAVAYVGGEMANPGRNIPRALILGTIAVTLLYVLLCASWIAVLGMGGIAESLVGPRAEVLMAGVIALALLGSINATILAGARIGYAMGRDGALPAGMARLSARAAVPTRALLAQAIFSIGLVLSGTFEELVLLTSVAMFLLGSLTVIALFVLRRREPGAQRPYRATLYPVLPLIYLVTAIAVIGLEVRSVLVDLGTSPLPLLGLAVFAAVWMAHRLVRRNG
jgi:APA family basic amino acid/polyamine antiporter